MPETIERWPMVAIHPAAVRHLAYALTPLAVNYGLIQDTLLHAFEIPEESARQLVTIIGPIHQANDARYQTLGSYDAESALIEVNFSGSLRETNMIFWHEIYHAARNLLRRWDPESQQKWDRKIALAWWQSLSVDQKQQLWTDPVQANRLRERLADSQYRTWPEERKARKYQAKQAKWERTAYVIDYETCLENPGGALYDRRCPPGGSLPKSRLLSGLWCVFCPQCGP